MTQIAACPFWLHEDFAKRLDIAVCSEEVDVDFSHAMGLVIHSGVRTDR